MKNRISEIREVAGLSKAEMARRIGTSAQHYGDLESGKKTLNQRWMEKIAEVLKVSPGDLLSDKTIGEILPNYEHGDRSKSAVITRILKIMNENGISESQLGLAVGLPEDFIKQRSPLTNTDLRKIAKCLGTSAEYLSAGAVGYGNPLPGVPNPSLAEIRFENAHRTDPKDVELLALNKLIVEGIKDVYKAKGIELDDINLGLETARLTRSIVEVTSDYAESVGALKILLKTLGAELDDYQP